MALYNKLCTSKLYLQNTQVLKKGRHILDALKHVMYN